MKGNLKTFKEGTYFYKEYSKNEFYFLKMLHGVNDLYIDTITKDNTEYIEIPFGHVISIDTIPKNHRESIKHIIIENIPFMLSQIITLNMLNIYYSDAMQWLYLDNKMYLIDFDTAYIHKPDYNYNNYDLFKTFLTSFNINSDYISESLKYLDIFKNGIDFDFNFRSQEETETYKKLNDETMLKNHVYYCRNQRHIQISEIKNIHIYGNTGNMLITENILNPELMKKWELIRIA